MDELIFFSQNNNKTKEVCGFLNLKNTKILTLNDFPQIDSPKETGKTFQENAIIKSIYGYKKFKIPCVADDSGICIEALNSGPGINSKRFILENGGIEKTIKIIIEKVKSKKNYKAFFQTSLALTNKKGETVCFDGIKSGRITNKPLGINGFGYDPVFIPEGSNLTYAQMDFDKKNKISHRYIAFKKLINFLN